LSCGPQGRSGQPVSITAPARCSGGSQRGLNASDQKGVIDRLADETTRSTSDSPSPSSLIRLRTHEDDGWLGVLRVQHILQLEPIQARHPDIYDRAVDLAPARKRKEVLCRAERGRKITD